MHNVYFDSVDIFDELRNFQGGHYPYWIFTQKEYDHWDFSPVTFASHESYVQLPTLRVGNQLHMIFKFKTSQPDGVILFNKGQGNKFVAIELINGYLHFKYNNGYKNVNTKIPTPRLDDNQWHIFEVQEIERGVQRQYQLKVIIIKNFRNVVFPPSLPTLF